MKFLIREDRRKDLAFEWLDDKLVNLSEKERNLDDSWPEYIIFSINGSKKLYRYVVKSNVMFSYDWNNYRFLRDVLGFSFTKIKLIYIEWFATRYDLQIDKVFLPVEP